MPRPPSLLLFDFRPAAGLVPGSEEPTQPDQVPVLAFLRLVLPESLSGALALRASAERQTTAGFLTRLIEQLDGYGGLSAEEVEVLDAEARRRGARNRVEFLFRLARDRLNALRAQGAGARRPEETPPQSTWPRR